MKRGRPREFDKEEALHQAMLLFWRRGYRGVSLDDLTEAMNITKPSIYAAFGDKESLFIHAIDYYRDRIMSPLFRQLIGCKELRHGLLDFFKGAARLMASRNTPGCLIACMLVQESCDSPAIRQKLAASASAADSLFARVLNQHRNQVAVANVEETARLLTCILHGLAIRARSGASERDMIKIADAFIMHICREH
jgi:AcrR family transcriptional regulator